MSKNDKDSDAIVWMLTLLFLGIILLFKTAIGLITAIISIPIIILNRKSKREPEKESEYKKEVFNDDDIITIDETKKKIRNIPERNIQPRIYATGNQPRRRLL